MISLKTDPKTNDLCLDNQGNISLVSGDEAIIQDVGSALSLWIGEIPFNPLLGINYDTFFLTNQNKTGDFILQLEKAAKNVAFVKNAHVILNQKNKSREMNGKIKITKNNNDVIYASF